MLINVLASVKPDYIVAALDGEKQTFRSEDFTGYKAHRKPMEEDFSSQIPKVFEIISNAIYGVVNKQSMLALAQTLDILAKAYIM